MMTLTNILFDEALRTRIGANLNRSMTNVSDLREAADKIREYEDRVTEADLIYEMRNLDEELKNDPLQRGYAAVAVAGVLAARAVEDEIETAKTIAENIWELV